MLLKLIHIITLFDKNITFQPISEYQNINYCVVITKNNINHIENFLIKFPNLNFIFKVNRIKQNEHSKNSISQTEYNFILNLKNKYKNFYIPNNLNPWNDPSFSNKIKLCSSLVPIPQFDIVNEKIFRCCTSYSLDKINLNKNSFLDCLFGYGNKHFSNNIDFICNSCNKYEAYNNAPRLCNIIFKKQSLYKKYENIIKEKI